MIGTAEELTAVVDIVLREGMPRGLILSTANTVEAPARPKSSVWSPMAILGEQDQDPLQRLPQSGNLPLELGFGPFPPVVLEPPRQLVVQGCHRVRDL